MNKIIDDDDLKTNHDHFWGDNLQTLLKLVKKWQCNIDVSIQHDERNN